MLPPFWDYLREYDELRDEILAAVDRVFKSGRLILGPEGVAFEREMAAYIGVTGGVGVNSGTNVPLRSATCHFPATIWLSAISRRFLLRSRGRDAVRHTSFQRTIRSWGRSLTVRIGQSMCCSLGGTLQDSQRRLRIARVGHEMVSTRYSKEVQWKRFEALAASI
jgi:hypothetical protein